MILYEFEGKELLKKAGIKVPQSVLIDSIGPIKSDLQNDNKMDDLKFPVVLKAQVLSGKRVDAGGVIFCDEITNYKLQITKLFEKNINNEKVEKILVEEKVEIEKEFYVSISYDTDFRSPILTISKSGGTGVEEKESKTFVVEILSKTVTLNEVKGIYSSAAPQNDNFEELVKKLVNLFFEQDCLLLEINPLVLTKNGEWVALDAKIKLDDDAKVRHEDPSTGSGQGWDFPPRLPGGRVPTQREIEAKKIDEGDYRGTAGSTYFDLDGDIAILSSGGGVSLIAMDALINAGGKPANFTEYSGNPPKEKVVKLTKIVLSKPNIHGLWVVGTVAANFTDIYETLSGIMEALKQVQGELSRKLDFPIVIRRGGPRDKEAFEMLKQVKDFNLILQGEEVSISESAKIMTDLAEKYKMSSRTK